MASIYRRTRSYPMPKDVEIIERRRKATAVELREDPERKTIIERFAKWTDGKGCLRPPFLPSRPHACSILFGSSLRSALFVCSIAHLRPVVSRL